MRIALLLLAATLCLTSAYAQPPSDCNAGAEQCAPKPPTKKQIKQATKIFERARKMAAEGKIQSAYDTLERAVELIPTNAEYVSFREQVKQQLITKHIETGNTLLNAGKQVEALAEFRSALALDPTNTFALQRTSDVLMPNPVPGPAATPMSRALTVVSESRPPVVSPQPGVRTFHFRGASRNLLELIAAQFGVKAIMDESVTNKNVRFDMENVDFFDALRLASAMAKVFWIPVTKQQIVFAADTQAQRRQLEHLVTRTFYLSNATGPQDVNDVVNLLRTIFEVRFVTPQPANNSIVVRAPGPVLDGAADLLQSFLGRKPQVNIEVQVFQVSHNLTRQLGLDLPTSFQAINVGAAALALLGQGGANSDLINQLISSGGINQIDPSAIQAVLAQLQNQQNSTISQLLKTPFATFGGGKTLFALPVPPATLKLQLNESDLQSLSKLTLRTSQNNAATMRLGSRYPILNASFAPVYNTSAISQVLQNGSYTAPFPSFTYEDLGITLKATPQVLEDNLVNLKLEMQIKALTGQAFNGVPVLSNQEYTATLTVKDAEPALVAGMITKSEQKMISGFPGLSQVPVLSKLTSSNSKQEDENELLIVVTPYVVSGLPNDSRASEVWLP